MATVGVLTTYEEGEDFTAWLERLEQYFVANDVPEEKRVAVLLTVLGDKTYGLLRSLVVPSKPAEKTFKELTDLLIGQLEPKRLVVAERFRFSRRAQEEGEAVLTYVAELKRLAATCNFGTTLGERLRDAFVAGVRNPSVQRRLLTEPDSLTLDQACQIALMMESAETQAQKLRTVDLSGGEALRLTLSAMGKTQGQQSSTIGPESREASEDQGACYRCQGGHLPSRCRFRKAKCRECHETGHIARACPKKAEESDENEPHTMNNVKIVEDKDTGYEYELGEELLA